MKIALLIERFHLGAGGQERSTEQIARRLIARGHAVRILTSSADADGGGLPAGTVIAAGTMNTRSALGLLKYRRWAMRHLDEGDYDASISMTTTVPGTLVEPRSSTAIESLARSVAMRRTPLKRALKRMSLAANPKRLIMLLAERRTIHSYRVKRLVAISRYVADQLFHYYSVSSRRIAHIPNASEARVMDAAERERAFARTREALSLAASDVVFLFPGRDPARKGLDALLQAMAPVHASEPRAKLVIAGVMGHRLDRRIALLGLADAVRCIGPTRMMDELYAACDVTVLPTWCDPASKVVLESLLHGVPAISTLYNGAAQWIWSPSGEHVIPSPFDTTRPDLSAPPEAPAGRVIESPQRPEELAAAMLELCDEDARRRCAEATRGIEQHITMDRHVELLEQTLIEVLEKSRPATESARSDAEAEASAP